MILPKGRKLRPLTTPRLAAVVKAAAIPPACPKLGRILYPDSKLKEGRISGSKSPFGQTPGLRRFLPAVLWLERWPPAPMKMAKTSLSSWDALRRLVEASLFNPLDSIHAQILAGAARISAPLVSTIPPARTAAPVRRHGSARWGQRKPPTHKIRDKDASKMLF